MEITEYIRSPLVPTDPEGLKIYIMDELDKIAYVINNLQYEIDLRLTALETP